MAIPFSCLEFSAFYEVIVIERLTQTKLPTKQKKLHKLKYSLPDSTSTGKQMANLVA